jgi:hypothetical protein
MTYSGKCSADKMMNTFHSMAQQPLVSQGLLIIVDFTIILRHTTLVRTPLDE